MLYEQELTDNQDNIYPVSLLGIEKITSNSSIDVGVAYEAFPHIPAQALDRPHDSGFVLGGSHKDIPQAGVQYTQEAKQLCSARFSRKLVGGKTCNLVRSLPSFLEAEELGTIVPRRL